MLKVDCHTLHARIVCHHPSPPILLHKEQVKCHNLVNKYCCMGKKLNASICFFLILINELYNCKSHSVSIFLNRQNALWHVNTHFDFKNALDTYAYLQIKGMFFLLLSQPSFILECETLQLYQHSCLPNKVAHNCQRRSHIVSNERRLALPHSR